MNKFRYCPYCGEELRPQGSNLKKRDKDEDTVRDIFVWLWDKIDSYCLDLGVNPDCTECKYGIAANALVGEYNCVGLLDVFKKEAERMIHNG